MRAAFFGAGGGRKAWPSIERESVSNPGPIQTRVVIFWPNTNSDRCLLVEQSLDHPGLIAFQWQSRHLTDLKPTEWRLANQADSSCRTLEK